MNCAIERNKMPPTTNGHLEEIDPQLRRLVEQMDQKVASQRDTKMTIIKSTRVYPEGLQQTLQLYLSIENEQEEKETSQLVQSLVEEVKALPSDGEMRLFVYLNTNDEVTELNYFCLAAQKYEHKGETVVDFCLSSYDYTVKPEVQAKWFVPKVPKCSWNWIPGVIRTTSASVSSNLMNHLSSATGGLVAIAATVASSLATYVPSGMVSTEKFNIENCKNLLKACFLYELVENGHVQFVDEKVYITGD